MTEPTRKRRWWPIVAGVVVALGVVVAGIGVASVLWFKDKVDIRPGATRPDAEAAFATEKAQFPDTQPMLVLDGSQHPRFADTANRRKNDGAIESVRVLAWSHDSGELATITLPFWLLRMKSGTFRFGERLPGVDDGAGLQLDAKDLERHGRGVVLETETPQGDRLLVTAR